MTDVQAPEREEGAPEPIPFLQGSFAMYATGGGEVVLATHTDLMGDQVVKVPKFVVNQARRSNPEIAKLLEGNH